MRPDHLSIRALLRRLDKTSLDELQCDLIAEIYRRGTVLDDSGRSYPLDSSIHPKNARALYDAVLKHRPMLAVEIGLAHGLSTLAILSAMRQAGNDGRLISIDPHQSTQWKAIGVAHVQRAGLQTHHTLIEQFDYVALPELMKNRLRIDFGYVDGMHTFDHVLLDFFFLDKLLRPGGIVGFNDCTYPAVRKTLRFIRSHRKYKEIDAGFRPRLGDPAPLLSLFRWISGRADRYFQKLEDWEPPWDHYARF